MNRDQKREFKKLARKRGFTDKEIDYLFNHKSNLPGLWEGAKVKLDVTWMKFHPDWFNNKLRREYKNWVLKNKNKEFTVMFDEHRKNEFQAAAGDIDPNFDSLVCLVEDETKPKWLFFAGDLILLSGGSPKPKSYEDIRKEQLLINQKSMEDKIHQAEQIALEREKYQF